MTFNTPIHTNTQSIDRVLQAGLPVLLAFWGKDCEPCEQLNPALDSIAAAQAGKALVAKVDANANPELAQRFNVTALPSLIMVRDGRVQARATGAAPESSVRTWVERWLSGAEAPAPSGPSIPIGGERRTSSAPPRPSAPRAPQPSPEGPRSGSTEPMTLTDRSFEQVVRQNEQPVLVDFWAPWCGPCRMIAPAVEQLARDFAGQAIVGKLNIDEYPAIAQRFGIQSIPAVFVFRRGQVVERVIGAQPATVLRQALQKHLR
jgi:thioredoxin 1